MREMIVGLKKEIQTMEKASGEQQKTLLSITERLNAMEATIVLKKKSIKFKTDRIESEFNDKRMDNRLKVILFALSGFTLHRYGKGITITCIDRTQAEQDEIYGDNEKYKISPWFSTHQFWRAADVRSSDFSGKECQEMVDFLNLFIYTGKYKTAIYHDGVGWHMHIQVDPDFSAEIRAK